ncbi:MAG: hypothetical protein JO100_13335 [Pseudonocardia sp.]|nr:hypothetical protein [Pseudonocardia sp.]
MADLTAEVIDALVRLMNGQYEIKGRPKDELYDLAGALINARQTLARTLAELNEQGETFAQIGERLGIHEATASRWAKPPNEDLRRRRRGIGG